MHLEQCNVVLHKQLMQEKIHIKKFGNAYCVVKEDYNTHSNKLECEHE